MAEEKMPREDVAAKAERTYHKREEVTIKFGKGLVEEPFVSKAGKELVEIKIPNQDPNDSRSWESFVVSPKMVHENQFGKGVWMKLPAGGETKVSRPFLKGKDENGRNIWANESRMVPNTELKAMMEAYKQKDRGSVLSDLSDKKAAVPDAGRNDAKPKDRVKAASR
ncbi:MAG: hypothetical protein LUC99_11345 [Clostridiales bacterium]|nr:hypothetical protein [Clostridiales bacterium]